MYWRILMNLIYSLKWKKLQTMNLNFSRNFEEALLLWWLQVQFQKQVIVVLSIIVATNIYVQWEQDVEESKFRLGLLGCATTLVFCSAPLASLVSFQIGPRSFSRLFSEAGNRLFVTSPYHKVYQSHLQFFKVIADTARAWWHVRRKWITLLAIFPMRSVFLADGVVIISKNNLLLGIVLFLLELWWPFSETTTRFYEFIWKSFVIGNRVEKTP